MVLVSGPLDTSGFRSILRRHQLFDKAIGLAF